MRPLAAAPLLYALACGGSLTTPDYVAQPTSALVAVPQAPPPAHVEFVPPQPARATVWIDGEWLWDAGRWSWRSGRWVVPPTGCRFAPWTMVRGPDGTIYYAGGSWRDSNDQIVSDPTPIASARLGRGQVVDPAGEPVVTGRTIH